MTTIRTTCPNCGDLELTIDQIQLEPGHYRFYRFGCPECGKVVMRPASPQVAGILIAVGVEPASSGPITVEEIDLFVVELDHYEGMNR
jgi:predicted RNA-binding Zn-ribbon protein involved in translation (DUF1610 family)